MKENFLTSAHGCRNLGRSGSDMEYRETEIRQNYSPGSDTHPADRT